MLTATISAKMNIQDLITAELGSLVELRRDLHRYPELSYQERRTSATVQRELAALGIAFKSGVGGTGVIGYLPATTTEGRAKPAAALRADMDALPIEEQTGKAWSSCTPGVMHACGHDGHTAMLIGAARVLSRVERPHPVLLLFQPAEEGGGGADKMCKEGALAGEGKGGIGNPVERIFGLHGWPTILPKEVIRATEEEKQEQIQTLQNLHKANSSRSNLAIEKLQQSALNNDNLFIELMEASKGCSLGQITNALYEVGGQYRRNM